MSTETGTLHSRFAHSDYEYETTTGQRKAWDAADVPPEGEGWERNVDAGRPGEGWDRFDYHEESYWRRPKRAHLWPCGCLRNDAGAHRAGCPDHPEGVRG
jgi:hypothetical protein